VVSERATVDRLMQMAEAIIRPAALSDLARRSMTTDAHFVRDHSGVPAARPRTFLVSGTVGEPFEVGAIGLARFPQAELDVVLECAGHRRSEYAPTTSGIPWALGAVSESRWGGVLLRDLLAAAVPDRDAVEVVAFGADVAAIDGCAVEYARSLPFAQALEGDVFVATRMNGEPIPPLHGGPLRLIVAGAYGYDSVKWLRELRVVTRPFAGHYQVNDYLLISDEHPHGVPTGPMPVNSLVVSEAIEVLPDDSRQVRGIAWGGGGVAAVEVSIDGGSYEPARLETRGPHARAFWTVRLPAGADEVGIAVRATSVRGETQPEAPRWNAKGYGNNSVQRVRLAAGGAAGSGAGRSAST